MSEREARLDRLIVNAHDILYAAINEHVLGPDRNLRGIVGLYSGGDDSTVLCDLFARTYITRLGHANTTIGIEATRVFVRQMARYWDIPLMERFPPQTYRELVLEQGFPGPGQHFKMYQRLKERCLREIRNELIQDARSDRVIFLAGRRRSESERRTQREIPEYERDGSTVWVSPLVHWDKSDINTYRMRFPDLPRNPVSASLHMSGECLCGAFAKRGELDEIGYWYPETKAEIQALEDDVWTETQECTTPVIPAERCKWGWGAYRSDQKRSESGPLCSSCEVAP